MKKLMLGLVLALAAVVAPLAAGGGTATVGLSSLPPSGLQAGTDWPVDITVLQHGQTPLTGVEPAITIRNLDTGATAGPFTANPTGKDGVYHAVVRFPAEGKWSYEVWDGFTEYGGAQTHTFKPVEIAAAGSGSSFPTLPVGGFAFAMILAAAVFLMLRRSRTAPQPAAARQ